MTNYSFHPRRIGDPLWKAEMERMEAVARARLAQPVATHQSPPALPNLTPEHTADEPISERSRPALPQSPAARKQAQVTAFRENVRKLALRIGIRAAARQYGLKELRVLNWACRYGWHIEKRKH